MLVRDPLLLIAPKRSKTEQRTLNSALKRSIDPTSARGRGRGAVAASRFGPPFSRHASRSLPRYDLSAWIPRYTLCLLFMRAGGGGGLHPLLFPLLSPCRSFIYIYIYMREIGEEGTSWMRFNENLKFSGINNIMTRKGK